MSRIGRMPIAVPAGVKVTVNGATVTVKGPKGELTRSFNEAMQITLEGNEILVKRPNDEPQNRALHGLTRTLISNMVVGVTEGYSKTLEISEGGYRVQKKGKEIVLALGFSHDVVFEEKDGITFDCPNQNTIVVNGIDKQAVGQVAAEIRAKRPPEPYLGKGVRYQGERIRRKSGKAGK